MTEPVVSNPSWAQLLRDPLRFAAFGFGAGLSPKAPGTLGTLVAIPLYLAMLQLPPPLFASGVIVMALLGIWICGRAASGMQVHDHPGIVWDEIVGFLIAMWPVAFSWFNLLAGFALFRLLDIAKPWPISRLDRNVKGGLGIMLDDIAAGICAGMVLWLINFFFIIS